MDKQAIYDFIKNKNIWCEITEHKAVFNMEELGMKYAADWIGELLNHEIPVHYVQTKDSWTFL